MYFNIRSASCIMNCYRHFNRGLSCYKSI